MKRLRLRARLRFFLERQFVKGAWYQLLLVAALIGLISIIGGALVLPSGEPTDSWPKAVWWAFLRLSDPGYLGDDQGAWRRFVSTLITIAGYVVFLGSLVAIITTWLNRKIRNLEQGLSPLVANNHIIIMGWTNRTVHIAAEIFLSVGRLRRFLRLHGKRNLELVILSEDVTPDHRQELRDYALIGDRARDIILRSGDAIDREDLQRVDSLNAAAIILPSQSYAVRELITPDIENIKALLSLNAEANRQQLPHKPYVVAEIQDENKVSAAHRAYAGPLEVIGSNTVISRLLIQNLRHPGLSEVFNELLSRSVRNNLFVREHPSVSGQTIARLRAAFSQAIILGVVRGEAGNFKPILNPPNDFTLEQGDRLIFIAGRPEDTDLQRIPNENPKTETIRARPPVRFTSGTTQVLILGWNHHVPALIREFGTLQEEDFRVTVASLRPLASRQKELGLLEEEAAHIQLEHLEADYLKEAQLRNIQPGRFDRIVLVSSDRLDEEEEADARTIVGYVLLEEVLKGTDQYPQVILELSDPGNETLIRGFRSEVIISPMILSHLLAAIALRRELHCIYNTLLTAGGPEIIFRPPADYEFSEGEVSFSELEQRAATFQEIALGIYVAGNGEQGTRQLVLNPPRTQRFELGGAVRLVVLTTLS